MSKTVTAFLICILCLSLCNSCTKGLDNHAVVTQIQLISFENKAWNITGGPNIYFELSDSITNTVYYSTRENPKRNLSISSLPVSWDITTAIPSSGHRFCLSFYNDEEPGTVLMQSIYFYLKAPDNMSSNTTVSQQVTEASTTAKLKVNWTN